MVLDVQKPHDPAGLTLEAWAQGYMVGSLVVLAAITVANMRRKVLLHKLILVELIFGMFQGTFIFPDPPYYGWYLSVGAIFLYASCSLHNVIAWIKNKPFLSQRVSQIYIGTVILVQPYWIMETVANFLYFNNINNLFQYTRPYEALFRDPWWLFTCCSLFWNIKRRYEFGIIELCRVSPRFAVLLMAMCISVAFIVVDILSVTHVIDGSGSPDGINPFWKLAFVFKLLTDTVILDDFKTALDRLKKYKLRRRGTVDMDEIATHGTADFRRDMETRTDRPMYNKRDGSNTKTRDWADLDIQRLDLEMPDSLQQPSSARTRSSSSFA